MTALNEVGGDFLSEGRRAAFRQFLIRGASCKFPEVFCKEGTGWYVRRAVRISGKTLRQVCQLFFVLRRRASKGIQAIVVFILPTFASKDILASSSAKAGISFILSLRTLEHLAES